MLAQAKEGSVSHGLIKGGRLADTVGVASASAYMCRSYVRPTCGFFLLSI